VTRLRAFVWLSLGGGMASALGLGACRKPPPDEIVYTGARRPPGSPGQGGAIATGGSNTANGSSSGSSAGARGGSGGTSGDSATGGRDPNGGGGGDDVMGGGAGGEAGMPEPEPQCPAVPVSGGQFTKRGLLEGAAACATREYCLFQAKAKALRDRALEAAAEPSEQAAAATREAWLAAMASWEVAEVLQFGPAAPAMSPGGLGLRDLIHAWPLVARCKVDEQIVNRFYANDAFFGAPSVSLSSGRTLHALEYLLFYGGSDNGCTQFSPINTTGSWAKLGDAEVRARRVAYAARAAEDVLRQAGALVNAWSPSGGDFASKLVEAGRVYASEHAALNAVGGALFYLEKQVKDGKLAIPLGLDMACPAASCPDQVEAYFAHTSIDHIAQNLRGFRKLFQGCADRNAGFGFDDWLVAVEAGDLSLRMLGALDGAEAAVATLDAPLETLVVSDPARVQGVYDALRVLTNLLKTEFVTTLNLERPAGTVGDND
jgi:predicted lipoprotein